MSNGHIRIVWRLTVLIEKKAFMVHVLDAKRYVKRTVFLINHKASSFNTMLHEGCQQYFYTVVGYPIVPTQQESIQYQCGWAYNQTLAIL